MQQLPGSSCLSQAHHGIIVCEGKLCIIQRAVQCTERGPDVAWLLLPYAAAQLLQCCLELLLRRARLALILPGGNKMGRPVIIAAGAGVNPCTAVARVS
jgi:hypothetical protein